ncbi:MAG: putative Glucuronide carrier protein [Promethearchaeota archaeon]|nr:MAG: putative Glucuronide carrier protein [Candidatus Lokiarchaeota archaeon]
MNEKKNSESDYSTKKATLYSLAGFTDVVLFQFFTFLIFTFFYAVVGLNVNLITLAFIIWSIWNAINDPMMGALSDKTTSKWGRRKPFIIAGIYPLLIINILLWTPPQTSQLHIFLYFLIIIILWEFFYTMWSLNQTSLFPEIFVDLEERVKANTIIQFFQIISLIIAFVLPSLFIPKYDDPQYFSNYVLAGIVISIICFISATIFIKFGIIEREEHSQDPLKAPSFLKSLNYTFKNKAFITYIIGTFALWYTFGMLPTIIPLYGSYVLGIDDSFLLSLLLAMAFLSAAGFVFLWRYIVRRVGAKTAFLLVIVSYIVTLSPFMFISSLFWAIISFLILGIGLSGALMIRDITIGAIIDEDELKNGVRREAGFYGINGFIIKLTNIFIYISIALVFNTVGWTIFDPLGTTPETIFGLRSLMFLFPTFFLSIGLVFMLFFPINKEKYNEITQKSAELHSEKREAFKRIKP